MWSVFGTECCVYLASRRYVLRRPDGSLLAGEHEDPASGLRSALANATLRRSGRRVRVLLSGAYARPFLMAHVAGLRSLDEACLAASSAASLATGLEGPCLSRVTDIPSKASALAAGMTTGVRDALLQTAADAGFVVSAVRPWWALALEQHGDALRRTAMGPGLAVVLEWDCASAYVLDAGVVRHVATLVPPPDTLAFMQWIARIQVTFGGPTRWLAQVAMDAQGASARRGVWPRASLTRDLP